MPLKELTHPAFPLFKNKRGSHARGGQALEAAERIDLRFSIYDLRMKNKSVFPSKAGHSLRMNIHRHSTTCRGVVPKIGTKTEESQILFLLVPPAFDGLS